MFFEEERRRCINCVPASRKVVVSSMEVSSAVQCAPSEVVLFIELLRKAETSP